MYIFTFSLFAILSLVTFRREEIYQRWKNEFCVKEYKSKDIIIFLFLAIFWLILHDGLRWRIGTDWVNYEFFFNNCYNKFYSLYFEFGYRKITQFIRFFTNNYSVFLIIHALIVYTILFFFIKKYSPYVMLSLFVFYFTMIGYLGMNRQYLSLCLCLIAFDFFIQKKYKYFYLLVFAAALFHLTALVFVIVPLFRYRISYKTMLIVLFISICISISGIINKLSLSGLSMLGDTIAMKLNIYTQQANTNITFFSMLFGTLKKIFWIVLLMIFHKQLSQKYKFFNIIFNTQLFALVLYVLFNGSIFQIFVSRCLLYFTIFEIITIPMIFQCMKGKIKFVFYAFLVSYGLFFLQKNMSVYYDTLKIDIFNPYNAIYMDNYELAHPEMK